MRLPLTAFEEYMLADNRPRHPMAYTVRLLFSGSLDPAALRSALRTAVECHPLFHSRLESSGKSAPAWVPSPQLDPPLDEGPMETPMRFPGSEQIDLSRENGLRAWVRSGGGQVDLCLQMHHACGDGVGAYQFLEDLLAAYHHAALGKPGKPELAPRDASLLARRARFGLSPLGAALRFPLDVFGALFGMVSFRAKRPAPLPSPEAPVVDEPLEQTVPRHVVRVFSREQLSALLAKARASRCTLNDLVLRDLFLAIYAWNERDSRLRRRCVRITVPMNIRGPDDEALPSTNVVGMVFLDRYRTFLADPAWLLASIRLESGVIKRMRLGISFARLCQFTFKVVHWPALFTNTRRCFSTVLLTNMGRFFHQTPLPTEDSKVRVGDLTLEAIESAPPVRPFMHASFSLFTYAGRLTLSMNYDRYHFTRQAAAEFLDCIAAQIARTAAGEFPA